MSMFRHHKSSDALFSAEPPESINASDWEALKRGTLIEIKEFHGQAASAQKLANVLETNTTLVALGTHLFSSNADELLSEAIVRSRNPNLIEALVDGIGGASEIILPVDFPPAVKRLFALRDYNRACAETLLDKLTAPDALTEKEAAQASLRRPAIAFIASRERNLDERTIEQFFEKLPPAEARPQAKPPFDAGLEAALRPPAGLPAPSRMKRAAEAVAVVMKIPHALLAAKRMEDEVRRRNEAASAGQNARS